MDYLIALGLTVTSLGVLYLLITLKKLTKVDQLDNLRSFNNNCIRCSIQFCTILTGFFMMRLLIILTV